jgi:hypothetical protein
MPGWLESFLIKLFLALGSMLLSKGKIKVEGWLAIEAELKANTKKAEDYQKVVDKPDATREERQRAEDDLLS